ncbi:olfactory receptor 51E1-like [Macrochelys suwanniensis]
MSDSNTTDFTHPSTFILMGIPGLEAAHVWISIPFCTMYAIAILGNFTILFIVKREPSLHGPMYYFLCMLAGSDLVLSMSILPKMLSIFWFNSREIDFSACLTQLYFIHCFQVTESGIFVAMALDRYVAICHPLRHSTILTNPVVGKIGLAVVLRSGVVVLPFPFLLMQWPYCRTNIPQAFCTHMPVAKLACADIHIINFYGLFVQICVMGLDGIFILVSYTQILRAIFCLPTKDARLKTFGTCSSHLCAIIVFYFPGLFFSLTNRFHQNVPLHFPVLIANVYLLISPILNPLIYGVRTKQIWGRLRRLFTHKAEEGQKEHERQMALKHLELEAEERKQAKHLEMEMEVKRLDTELKLKQLELERAKVGLPVNPNNPSPEIRMDDLLLAVDGGQTSRLSLLDLFALLEPVVNEVLLSHLGGSRSPEI